MKFSILTLGCKLNQFESQAISENMEKNGFVYVDNVDDANIVIINSCTVTDKADQKTIGFMKKFKKKGKHVVLTGCFATTDLEKIKSLNYADLIIDNKSKFMISEILKKNIILVDNKNKSINIENNSIFPHIIHFETTRAFVKIQDGCNKFCSYCKIPYARGRSVSCEPENILKNIEDLIYNNYKEIVLTGINISDYNYKGYKLFNLVKDILDLNGIFRIRLSSLQPDEFDERFVEFLGKNKFANHFHLSLQSGSDSVLKRMNRHYTTKDYHNIIKLIREYDKTCGITTDIIVGFPEESEYEFNETLEFIKLINFTRIHFFPYSRRSGTLAARYKDLQDTIKKDRMKILENESIKCAINFYKENIINREFEVLIENYENEHWEGYTSNYFKIYSKNNDIKKNNFYNLIPRNFVINKSVLELKDY